MIRKNKRFRTQIVYIFLLTFVSLFLVNVYIFRNVRIMIEDVNDTYEDNRNLMEMREWLDHVHGKLTEYLDTKDEDSLDRFYLYEESFKLSLEPLRHEGNVTEIEIRENTVSDLATSYIKSANNAVLAKSSGNIERYRNYQTRAESEYAYLTAYMTDLNNQLFYTNSAVFNQTYKAAKYSEIFYALLLFLMGGVDVCILLLLIRRLTDPLQELAIAAKEVGAGNLDIAPVETADYNEIGVVSHSFNQMVVSLKDYIEKFKKSVEAESAMRERSIQMEASVKDAQLKYLQAQINPHFLFNTINAGAQLAMLEDADRTYGYLLKVADFFRYKIKNGDAASTLREELQLVDDYIYIINVRYAGAIQYETQVDESLLSVALPSMVLQPLVENSVKHGLKDVEWEKKVTVSVTSEEDTVVVSVRDNGVGIPQEDIQEILSEHRETKGDEQEGGVGLVNVITRLRMFYNKEDIVEITSVGTDMGTEVALFLPKERKENKNVQDLNRG